MTRDLQAVPRLELTRIPRFHRRRAQFRAYRLSGKEFHVAVTTMSTERYRRAAQHYRRQRANFLLPSTSGIIMTRTGFLFAMPRRTARLCFDGGGLVLEHRNSPDR